MSSASWGRWEFARLAKKPASKVPIVCQPGQHPNPLSSLPPESGSTHVSHYKPMLLITGPHPSQIHALHHLTSQLLLPFRSLSPPVPCLPAPGRAPLLQASSPTLRILPQRLLLAGQWKAGMPPAFIWPLWNQIPRLGRLTLRARIEAGPALRAVATTHLTSPGRTLWSRSRVAS